MRPNADDLRTARIPGAFAATLLVLGIVGLVALAAVAPVTGQSDGSLEIGLDNSDGELAGTESIDLVATNVNTSEGIGAYNVNVTYNSSQVELDISGTDRFYVESTTYGENGQVTTSIVGYTDSTEASGSETVTLAAIEATGLVENETTELSVSDVETIVEPEDATELDYQVGDTVTVDVVGGLAVYSNSQGVIDTPGLQNAITDWVSGDVDTGLLRDIIRAWVSGEEV